MTDVHQQVDHLKRQIDTGAEETNQYLATLKKRVDEYDTHNQYSEKASDYLQSGIDTTMSAVEELKHVGNQLQDQTKEASDDTIFHAQRALNNVNESLRSLQDKAREYDRKFSGSRGSQGAGGVEGVVNAARQRASDVVEMASEQATRVKEMIQNTASNVVGGIQNTASNVAGGIQNTASSVADSTKYGAQVAVGGTANTVEAVDEKLGVSPMMQSAVSGVTGTVKSIDERLHVTETAAKIDAKVTGGLGMKVVNKGVEIVQESIDYVTDTLQHAKLVAGQSPAAQKVESQAAGVAQQASETAGAAKDKASSATDQVSQSARAARDKTMETAGSARDSAMNMATSAKERVMGPSETSSSSTTQQTKEMAGHGADMAKERGMHASETAQSYAGAAKQKGSEMLYGAQQKGSEMMEGGKQSMEHMKGRAGEMGTGAKEATMGMSSGESATDRMERERRHGQGYSQAGYTGGHQGYGQAGYMEGHQGGQGYVGQVAASAEETARQAKDKISDVSSRQKAVMKDSTRA